MFFPVAMLLGLLAIIFGVVNLSQVRKGTSTSKGMSIAGIITGVLGLLGGTVVLLIATYFTSTIEECTQSDPVAQQQCIEERLNEELGQ